jgi:low temperature requirement protein LtrA
MAEGSGDARTADRNRVCTLELCFDLVLVFTLAQLV